jgi:hypothetical protein
MKMKLSVYANSVTEWYVAESPEQARAMLLEANSISHGPNIPEAELDLEFTQEPDDKVLKLEIDESGDLQVKELTCAEWAAKNGKGFLATTEY